MKPTKIYYIFQGWKNEDSRKKFHGDFDFYEQEMQSGRAKPATPPGLLIMRSENVDKEMYESAGGTPISSKIEVQYIAETLTQDDLARFIENIQCNLEKID